MEWSEEMKVIESPDAGRSALIQLMEPSQSRVFSVVGLLAVVGGLRAALYPCVALATIVLFVDSALLCRC